MQIALRDRRLVRRLSIALMGCALALVEVVRATEQKQVLVLYSTRRDAQISVLGDRALPRLLEPGLEQGLDYYTEYLDLSRFSEPGYQASLADFLHVKYKKVRFDLVIAMQDIALDFAAGNGSRLFPDTPIVFFSSSSATRRVANSTGVTADLNFSGTLSLAAELQPDIRRVVVVTGADARDKEFEILARAQFGSFEDRLEFTYLSGLVTRDLEARLATLPANSIIYYLVVSRDGAGESFHPLEYLDRLAAVANAPIYSWVDSAMDHGIVGGSLKSQKAQTEAVGRLALQVLRGAPADSIPTSSPDLQVNQVDWRQLRRWGISEARVRPGTLVMFREPSAWDRYQVYILGAAAVLLAQTALIVGLLLQSSRRQRAEAQVRRGQAALRASYERIRDLGSRLLSAQDTERSRVSRELHDDISQQVALLTIDLELLSSAVPSGSEELADEVLNRTYQIARSVHDLSHRLHPSKLRLLGLVASVQALQRELSRSEIAIAFTHDNVPTTLPPDVTVCLFRIVQEALQNAVKHSRAREVSVHLQGAPDALAMTIVDDGVGFDVEASWRKGLGLVSMDERLEAVGGALEIRSRPGAGTRLEVKVPLSVLPGAETDDPPTPELIRADSA